MVSLPTSSDSEHEIDYGDYYGEEPFEYEHKGFPENCFCGADAILEKKRTGPDAGRLYYRCANSEYQDNTVHLGKWFEEAVQEEWQLMRKDISRLQSVDRVDDDYVRRLRVLEASCERMQTTVSRLAGEAEGWSDEFTVMALDVLDLRVATERIWGRLRAVAMAFSLVVVLFFGLWATYII